jgi:hypothetical protein
MPKKQKFKPEITRVKLNPEQAVLSCSCYSNGMVFSNFIYRPNTLTTICGPGVFGKNVQTAYVCSISGSRTGSSTCQDRQAGSSVS